MTRYNQLTASILAALLLWPSSLRAETLRLGYEVAWGNFTLAEAEVKYREDQTRYHLAGQGRTEGLLEWFFTWHGTAETEGLLEATGRRPLAHQSEGTWNDSTRSTRVAWPGKGPPTTETQPPPDLELVTPVPKDATAGTSDPFTAVLQLLDSLAETGRCEAEAKVWDGRRRYDLAVAHIGPETLVPDRPWAYGGPAVACALSHQRIGGFWRDSEAPEATRRVVWAAEIAPGRWALVRAEVDTSYGTVVARLKPAPDVKAALEN
ncbi:MAG: DUF3108 domain-containing protein [Pseudomonadota bacterium]